MIAVSKAPDITQRRIGKSNDRGFSAVTHAPSLGRSRGLGRASAVRRGDDHLSQRAILATIANDNDTGIQIIQPPRNIKVHSVATTSVAPTSTGKTTTLHCSSH